MRDEQSASDSRALLVRQLQGAYSGELAAGYAYRGHARSVRDAAEIARIEEIEAEEWHHRELVGAMLRGLSAAPNRMREAIFWCVGHFIAFLCHTGGWFMPMFGAGKLERGNIVEYEIAAEYALACGREDLIECLLAMAEVEWEHERYFRSKVEGHWMLRWFRLWDPAPPKETIRANFSARREGVIPSVSEESGRSGEAGKWLATKPTEPPTRPDSSLRSE